MTKSKIEQWAEEIAKTNPLSEGSEGERFAMAMMMADKFLAEAEKLAFQFDIAEGVPDRAILISSLKALFEGE